MAKTSRQTAIFGVSDWKTLYQTYSEADFQSYDFETLRKSFVDYLRLYYPETYNDFTESSELIALTDIIAFMGQSLAFRTDLNTRENYIDTAERRDSVVKLANLVSYTAKRNTEAHGFLKIFSVSTTENVIDYNGINLSNITINWADPSNFDWLEQWNTVINASLVNTQRVGRPSNSQVILGVKTDEYTINLVPGFLAVVPFTATIDGVNMPFEAVNASSIGSAVVYEPSPVPNGAFNMLFRNDQLGYASANTGYFFYFKQGVLQNQDFNLAERISNRTVDINIEGVNNTDKWLFQIDDVGNVAKEWTFVENVYSAAAEQSAPDERSIFAVSSRTNDQITLVFGDGVFSEIPVGTFRCYVRASNGLQYIINPEEMQSVVIPINYVSRTGQIETITFTCGITEPVTNAQARETLTEIKQRAPARYYTQNRMVNGEDYNNFPFTAYNSIIKSHAINRSSIGTSRYLDLVDNTGKYSSTDSFASDGAVFENVSLPSFSFTWNNSNDIYDIVANRIQPLLSADRMMQFYRANFPRPSLLSLGLTWNLSTHLVNETTGYFKDPRGFPVQLGTYSSTNAKYIQVGSLVKILPPTGYHFNSTSNLVVGPATQADDKTYIWSAPEAIYEDGTAQGYGNLPDGTGPVVLNTFVPNQCVPAQVIPLFVTDLPNSLIQQVVEQITLNRNFGLGYNNLTATWYLITSNNLDINAAFSLANAQSTSGTNNDSSWLIQATTENNKYTVVSRSLEYYFGSVIQTRFFFYTNQKIYDSRTGTTIQDYVNVLKTNSKPDSNQPMEGDTILKITGQPILSDGYVDDFIVTVSYYDAANDGAPDDPDFFDEVVAPTVNPNTKLVFFQQTVDFDNLQRYLLVAGGTVNVDYQTKKQIELILDQYLAGQMFYAWNDIPGNDIVQQNFYQLVVDSNGVKSLADVTNTWLARVGRQNLYFQYRHNAPVSNRIDPSTTNIIDLYVVTLEYYTAYENWIKDSTGTVAQPIPPSIDQLTTDYANLQTYKMISDNLIVNSVEFKPLYGAKADPSLRGIIKVVKAQNTSASDSEVKNLVINYMDTFFDIANWNFGDTVYFSELASYIHQNAGDVVSSVVLVPLDTGKAFGDLYEIRCAPNQIPVNAATVNDVEIITALTSTNLRTAPGSGVI